MNSDFVQDDFKFRGFYRGLVLDNVDPSQLGRIKIRVYNVFASSIPTAQLPWAVPAAGLFTGSGPGYGSFVVPEINSQVFVFFEGMDLYQPVYFAEAPSAVNGLPSERTTNYPYRKVWKTKNEVVFYIDDKTDLEEVKLEHPKENPTKTSVVINKDGELIVTGQKSSTIVIDKDGEIASTGQAGSSIVIDSAGVITATGAGSTIVIDVAGKITITGGDITVSGDAVVIEGTTVNINP